MLCTWCGELWDVEEMQVVEKVGVLCPVCIKNLERMAKIQDEN